MTNAELVQLRIRVIALENLVISLLPQSSDRQLDLVREMAAYICPRPGFTPHRLPIRAAAEMIRLVERAEHFRDTPPGRTKVCIAEITGTPSYSLDEVKKIASTLSGVPQCVGASSEVQRFRGNMLCVILDVFCKSLI